MRLAASRTFWTAGNNRAIKAPMMAMTTSNSISVNAGRQRSGTGRNMEQPPPKLLGAEDAARSPSGAGTTAAYPLQVVIVAYGKGESRAGWRRRVERKTAWKGGRLPGCPSMGYR